MNKTFTFLQRISSPPHSLSKNSLPPAIIRRMSSNLMKAPLQEPTPVASQNPPPDSLLESIHKNFNPKPQHTSNPLQAPPARILSSSPPPCWLAGWKRVGGPPSSYPLISSPPPVLHSIHTHTSHFVPPVHQDRPLEVLNVDSLRHLSVQAARVHTCHLHNKIDLQEQ